MLAELLRAEPVHLVGHSWAARSRWPWPCDIRTWSHAWWWSTSPRCAPTGWQLRAGTWPACGTRPRHAAGPCAADAGARRGGAGPGRPGFPAAEPAPGPAAGPGWRWQMNLALLGDRLDDVADWPALAGRPVTPVRCSGWPARSATTSGPSTHRRCGAVPAGPARDRQEQRPLGPCRTTRGFRPGRSAVSCILPRLWPRTLHTARLAQPARGKALDRISIPLATLIPLDLLPLDLIPLDIPAARQASRVQLPPLLLIVLVALIVMVGVCCRIRRRRGGQ